MTIKNAIPVEINEAELALVQGGFVSDLPEPYAPYPPYPPGQPWPGMPHPIPDESWYQ